MAILLWQVTKIIGHMQTSLIIRNTQIHGLHFCNPRTKRIVSEGILRYIQDDIPSDRDCHVGHSPPCNDDTMRCHSERSEESP